MDLDPILETTDSQNGEGPVPHETVEIPRRTMSVGVMSRIVAFRSPV